MTADKSTCRGCGKPILWVKNAEGKPVPFDARATQVLLDPEDEGLSINRPMIAKAHLNHFLTCKRADDFRKGKA